MVPAVPALVLPLLFALAAPPDAAAPIEIEPAPHPQPPPPSIEFPPPDERPNENLTTEELEGKRVDPGDGRPPGTTPPGEDDEGVTMPVVGDDDDERVNEDPDEDDAPLDWTIEERRLDEMPYAATAARKSAVRRGNEVLIRPFRKPVYSVAAAARLGVQLGGGRDIIQPIAWGVAAQIRLHFLRVVKSRFGIEIHAGHTRWQQRDDFEVVAGEAAQLTRTSLLTHTDVSAGPSFEIPLGPVFVQFGVTGGFAVSTLVRARSADTSEDDQISEFDGLLRGGLSLGLPISNGQGLVIGVAVQQVFSKREILIDPNGAADGAKTSPFGMWLESFVGYQVWF